jgi:predicted RNA-binding protein with PUA-like domain
MYWLFKSEPTTFSIDDLILSPDQTTHWNGIRNYQVRNMLRDDVQVGDQVFFYHSNCTPPGIVGIMEVVTAGYPDFTALDKKSDYFDPKSSAQKPIWYMVDVRFVKKFKKIISLDEIKNHPGLQDMLIVRKGNRLSITPVTADEWKILVGLG